MTDTPVPTPAAPAGCTLGLLGCGQLGGALALALLRAGTLDPAQMWICNRSGPRPGFDEFPTINWTREPSELAENCETLLLALPPASVATLKLEAPDRLVISVMAGIDTAQLSRLTGALRVIRAMSSPAAETGMAYSPFYPAPGASVADRERAWLLLSACGLADEVPEEGQIDVFTAITGPVPGFVAYFAMCVQDYAQKQGVAPDTARRAVGQLFLAASEMMAASPRAPSEFVSDMIDYAGTTAAGLNAMEASSLRQAVADGLEAARLRCRTIGKPGE